jgi:hypothetical protein
VSGVSQSMVGHWIHIGGMLAGICIAMILNLGQEAIEERHLEVEYKAGNEGKVSLESGEDSLRKALQNNPENPEELLLSAQPQLKNGAAEEGCNVSNPCASDHSRA